MGETVKLDVAKLYRIGVLLSAAVQERVIPGAVAAVGQGTRILWNAAVGWAQVTGGQRVMRWDTRFDLASLTKVTATLPAILILAASGEIGLQDTVDQYLPLLSDMRWKEVSVRHLLTHTAGLAAARPYYRTCSDIQAFLTAIAQDNWLYRPGTRVVYSDLGYILLGEIIRAVSGQDLATFCRERVFRPLGMDDTGFCPPLPEAAAVAATEVVSGKAMVGVVHDENARALGGVAGHAGLFASAKDLARYLGFWTTGHGNLFGPWLREASCRLATGHLDGKRGLGWVLYGDAYSVTGDFWPMTTAEHTGFTGTSVAFDPVSGVWAILLTNRLHYGRDHNLRPLRRMFHNMVAAAVTA